MKRLLVGLILLLNVVAYAETPARVRLRVRLPFEPTSPSAVVLPAGTLVTVLWPQDDKLMIRYRRLEGLVPAERIHYDASAHPEDVRQYRPDPESKESESTPAPVERTANIYSVPTNTMDSPGAEPMFGSFPLYKVVGGLVLVVVVMVFATRERKEDNNGRLLRRQA